MNAVQNASLYFSHLSVGAYRKISLLFIVGFVPLGYPERKGGNSSSLSKQRSRQLHPEISRDQEHFQTGAVFQRPLREFPQRSRQFQNSKILTGAQGILVDFRGIFFHGKTAVRHGDHLQQPETAIRFARVQAAVFHKRLLSHFPVLNDRDRGFSCKNIQKRRPPAQRQPVGVTQSVILRIWYINGQPAVVLGSHQGAGIHRYHLIPAADTHIRQTVTIRHGTRFYGDKALRQQQCLQRSAAVKRIFRQNLDSGAGKHRTFQRRTTRKRSAAQRCQRFRTAHFQFFQRRTSRKRPSSNLLYG